jgi:hypothetical protein
MKTIHPQYKDGHLFLSDQDRTELNKQFKNNQFMTGRMTAVSKKMEPSIEQNNTLFSCFNMLAENNDNPMMQNIEAVKEFCKIGIDFRDRNFMVVRPDGGIQLKYRSFSFKDLPYGKERDEVVEKAFNWTADELGLTVDEMVLEAKSRMLSK